MVAELGTEKLVQRYPVIYNWNRAGEHEERVSVLEKRHFEAKILWRLEPKGHLSFKLCSFSDIWQCFEIIFIKTFKVTSLLYSNGTHRYYIFDSIGIMVLITFLKSSFFVS